MSVIIPLYCEGGHLERSVAEITKCLDALDKPYEIILVDDGSTDDTWKAIQSLARMGPHIRAVRFSRNFGKESAMSAGLERARGDAAILMDGDLQHPPEVIPEMVRLWSETGADVVDAVKAERGRESWPRKTGAALFHFLMRRLSGFDLSGASDFKLLDRKVLDAWLQMGETQLFTRGMIEWLGFSHAQVSFNVPARADGESAWSFVRLARFAVTALTSFSSLPLHVVSLMGLLFLLAAIGLGAWTFYAWLAGRSLTGFTTVILLQLGIGSIVLLSLGIIGEYVANVYNETKRRPRYVVAETIDATRDGTR